MSKSCFELITDRLILRELIEEDLDAMCRLSLDEEVTKFLDYIKFDTREKVAEWLRGKIVYNNERLRHSYNLAITLKATGMVVGWVGIGEPSDKTKADLDFGYAVEKEYWRQGYASEALKALLSFCFSELHVRTIAGDCDSENIASVKVMEKVGMHLDYVKKEDGRFVKHFVIKDVS